MMYLQFNYEVDDQPGHTYVVDPVGLALDAKGWRLYGRVEAVDGKGVAVSHSEFFLLDLVSGMESTDRVEDLVGTSSDEERMARKQPLPAKVYRSTLPIAGPDASLRGQPILVGERKGLARRVRGMLMGRHRA